VKPVHFKTADLANMSDEKVTMATRMSAQSKALKICSEEKSLSGLSVKQKEKSP